MSVKKILYPSRIGVALALASIILYVFFSIWPLFFSIGIAFTNATEENLLPNPDVLKEIDNTLACIEAITTQENLSTRAEAVVERVTNTLRELENELIAFKQAVEESEDHTTDLYVMFNASAIYVTAQGLRLIPEQVQKTFNCTEIGFQPTRPLISSEAVNNLSVIYSSVSQLSSQYIVMGREELLSRIDSAIRLIRSAEEYFIGMSSDLQGYFDTVSQSLINERNRLTMRFIGLENFQKLFTDPRFVYSLYKTAVFVATSVPLKLLAGVALAFLYSSPLVWGRKVLRGLILAPWAIPILLSGLTWRFLFNPNGQLGRMLGLDIYNYEWDAFLVYNLFETWLAYPFIMTVTMGALAGVSKDLVEASYIDGASTFTRLRRVVLPLISKPLMFATILTTGASLQAFMVPLLLNAGGPTKTISIPGLGTRSGNVNEFLILFGYNRVSIDKDYGYAAATYLVIVMILLVYVTIWFISSKKLRGGR
ncbi:ABC transporter permease subunit [Thermosphaera chiliense]|uniref:ABC transporter permease subunit n=1 Tax=Thermosphaera chiliense TaxID=3402707 RepID=A0A7M1UTL3_9CREN|nr:ABC transporter permease subunit [Thermosphaera aggregans]QOR94542.1 ABC transporter permease subunit [Thermosphaera aggregans]